MKLSLNLLFYNYYVDNHLCWRIYQLENNILQEAHKFETKYMEKICILVVARWHI